MQDWRRAPAAAQPAYLELSPALLAGAQQVLVWPGIDLPPAMYDFINQAIAVDTAARDREKEEQQRRLDDAFALAAAKSRLARRTGFGLAASLLFAALAIWQWRAAEAVGAALTKANASTVDEEIDAATSMALAIWKFQTDYKTVKAIVVSPVFANIQDTDSYQAVMKHLALVQDVVNGLVQSYSSLLQSVVVSESPADVTQAIAAEQSIMRSKADPRIAFVNLTQTFLNQLSKGAVLKNSDIIAAIQSVKISQ